jgi:hypothetical protein
VKPGENRAHFYFRGQFFDRENGNAPIKRCYLKWRPHTWISFELLTKKEDTMPQKIYFLWFLFLLITFFTAPVQATSTILAVDSSLMANTVLDELSKAGWRKEVAQKVVALNQTWFTELKNASEKNFQNHLKLLKQFNPTYLVEQFLLKHPEMLGLLNLADDSIAIIKILKKSTCYNEMTTYYALHPTPLEIQKLTEALSIHRSLLCQLAKRNILGAEVIFMFPRKTRGAKEYEIWLKKVFNQYLRRTDHQLVTLIAYLIEHGQEIRQRLETDSQFYQRFRHELWPQFIRITDNLKAFEWLANEPYIWDLLALQEGEILLEKWGLGPISLLFGEQSYPADMRATIIQILLQGDDDTVEALFQYKEQPLFRQLLRRQFSVQTQAALAKKLVTLCPTHSEANCSDVSEQLRYLVSLTDNQTLAEEIGPQPKGPITWLPFHGSYHAIRKMSQGRKMTKQDIFNLSLDALIFIPAALFAMPFAQTAQPLTGEIILDLGIVGALDVTPRVYHLVKPIGKAAIRTGTRTGQILTQSLTKGMIKEVVLKQGQKTLGIALFKESAPKTHDFEGLDLKVQNPLKTTTVAQSLLADFQFQPALNRQVYMEISELRPFLVQKIASEQVFGRMPFQPKIYVGTDTQLVMLPTHGLNLTFFQTTAHQALLAQQGKSPKKYRRKSKDQFTAWQHNISAWWLMNAMTHNQ